MLSRERNLARSVVVTIMQTNAPLIKERCLFVLLFHRGYGYAYYGADDDGSALGGGLGGEDDGTTPPPPSRI